MSEPEYCPFYCEENLWHLAGDPRVGEGRRHVLLISNAQRSVALWQQRAGVEDQGGLVVWDYHVVLVCDGSVWDLDTTLGYPVPLATYVPETFRGAPSRFAPMFRIMEAEVYRQAFASDRRHMRAKDGTFLKPPPPWPPIGQGHTLDALLDFERSEPGAVVDLPGLVERSSSSTPAKEGTRRRGDRRMRWPARTSSNRTIRSGTSRRPR